MGGKSLTVRPLAASDVELYGRLANEYGGFFDSIKWTGLFGPNIRRYGIYDAGDNLRGGFCLSEQRRFVLSVFRNPPFTPSVGPFFEYRATNPAARTQEQRDVVEALAELLDGSKAAVVSMSLSVDTTDCLPFYWRGFKVVPHYTYRLDLHATAEGILGGMSPERRKNITKARKDGIEVTEVSETGELRSLVLATFARQDKEFPDKAMRLILEAFPPGTNSACFIARKDGRPVAGVYIVFDSGVAFYLMGGYVEGAHHGAGALAMYHAILKAKALGLEVFDFEGSSIPAIEKYFRGFGGHLTPIFSVHKAWLPLEMLMKLKYRDRF